MKRLGAIVAAILMLNGTSWAASVGGIQGDVLINQGDGFKPVSQSVTLKPGDTVIANPGGRARVMCDNGAQIVVEPGSVVTVADCDSATAADQPNGKSFFESGGYIIGAVAIAGGVALAIGLSNGSDHPASSQ